MSSAAPVRIALAADRAESIDDVRRLLAEHGQPTHFVALGNLGGSELASCELLILDGGHRTREMLQLCRRVRSQLGEHFLPILLLTEDPEPGQRQACLDAGADAYLLRPFAAVELLAQVRAFQSLKGLHDRLAEKSIELQRINERLQETHLRMNRELDLARRLQRSLLPTGMPDLPGMRFAVHYQPCGRVGGDFYDVFRLGDHQVGFYIADVMGHGIPASLLTCFLKKAVHTRDQQGRYEHLLAPDSVLQRLNHELVELGIPDMPFVTMIYAVYDVRNLTLRFARAGHPHPVYVPSEGEPVVWSTPGSLLGVFETKFAAETRTLRPGDRVVLYTDGVAEDSGSLVALAGRWRTEPLHTYLESLARELPGPTTAKDDATLLVLEVTPQLQEENILD